MKSSSENGSSVLSAGSWFIPNKGFISVHMSVVLMEQTYGSSNVCDSLLLELLLYAAHPNDVHLLILGQFHDG